MGSASSKFRKHLSNGDEVAALNLYNNNSDLRKGLDPNSSYGDSHNHDTPLHYAAKHGMKSLLRIFLHDHHGNPNKTNGKKETCLHCLCTEKPTHAQFYPVQKKRLDCLHIMLKWRGAELKDGEKERVDLTAQDENENTALHYAAASGLKYCVETLVQYGAPLFTENNDQETPCDSAERGGHAEIALYLESKMVFSNVGSEEEGTEDTVSFIETEDYSGLRAQDLQEAKDQLLVETADMLSVPLFTAEALLRNHEWSRETLLEAWMSDPLSCCDKCGVIPPPSVFCDKPQVQESLVSHPNTELTLSTLTCDICTQSYRMQKENIEISCEHKFCKDCWTEYLNLKIQEGDAHHITCPAYQCDILVPVEMIERVVSRDMARRYLQFDIKAFVDSNPNIKWCPYPGCARAVRLPELENSGRSQVIRRPEPTDTSRAVDCGNGHYFCWDCSGEAHEPSSCENWTKWYKKVAEIKPEELSGTEEDTKAAANCLWLVTNSKPCPNCKSPIQKNEGCNHMKCSKCKHDFCWVCLDQWKRHNSSTGGYFKCNRYEAVKVVQEETQKAQSQAEEKNQKMQELNKFVHYYTRFKNHENSYKLEEPLLSTTKNKMLKLAEAVTDLATANSETQFVEHAVQQLLKARRVLKCSYVYGYYLDGPGYKKIVFEFMQTELEECTEILSQMVNRLYLRTPRKKIIEQAHIVQRKRHEFILAISKGLVPPETPPGLRKHRRRKYSMDFEDDELRKAIMASMQEVDLSNPWIKDASGRHTNVMAVLDWPDSDDSDIEDAYTMQQGRCQHKNCRKPRAKNPRTGEIHRYCSRQCMYDDKLESPEQSEPVQEVIMDEQMDLLRALEMSRLQYLHDQGIISGERGSIAASLLESPHTTEATPEDSPVQRSQDKSPRSSSRQRSPKQKSPGSKQRGKGKGRKSVQAAMEELDLEIQRVLEISSISPAELEESLVSRTMLPPPVSSPGGNKQRSRHEEALSPCVPSVPNKSMDDTQHDDCLNCLPEVPREDLISLDFGLNADIHVPTSPIPQQQPMFHNRVTRSKVRNQSDMPKETPERGCITDQSAASLHETNENSGSCFGIIKDISVSNLHIEDKDKVKTFPQINIRQLSMQEGIQAYDAESYPTTSQQESVTPPKRSRSKIFDDEGFMLSPLDSTMEYSTPDDFENRSMKISSISSGSRSNEENQRSHEKQKSKYSVLSAIAANTPGEDEMDRFVLCSPAESHADHVISYSSQDSPFEQEVVYDKSEDEACDGMTNFDGSASEELIDLDNYPESSYQMDHYSSEFIKSLLKDKAYYHDSEDEAEPMDQSEQSSQCFDQSKDSSVLTSHNLDVDALCIQPISDEVSGGHMDNLGEDVWVRRTELNDNQDHSYNLEPSNGRQTRHDSNIINQNQEEVTTIDNSYLAQNITTSHGQNNSEESETKDGESESREAPSAEPDGDLYKKDKSFFV